MAVRTVKASFDKDIDIKSIHICIDIPYREEIAM